MELLFNAKGGVWQSMPSRLSYYVRRFDRLIQPKAIGIERLTYAVTYRCNSRCMMCNIWQGHHSDRPELTLGNVQHTFSNTSWFRNLTDIGLTGGEPFLREDLDQIGRFFLDTFPCARISINTNGLLADRIYSTTRSLIGGFSLRERNRVRISFSIDGMGKTHDLIRGIPNGFEKVLNTVERMQERIPGLEYGLTFTVLPENYDQIWEVYHLSKAMKVVFSFSLAQVSGVFYRNEDMRFRYTSEMLETVDKQIRDIQRDDPSYRNYYYSHMVEYQNSPRKYVVCYAGFTSCFLDPYGEVFPCILYDQSLGNIQELSMQEMWSADQAKQIRNRIQKTRCHCWSCESEVSLRRSWKTALWAMSNGLRRHRRGVVGMIQRPIGRI